MAKTRLKGAQERPQTPEPEPYIRYQHLTTPKRAKLIGAVEYLESNDIKFNKTQLFKDHGVHPRQGFNILKHRNTQRLHNDPARKETRGRKRILTEDNRNELRAILEKGGREGRALSYEKLAVEIGVDVSEYTVKRELTRLGYPKFMANQKKAIPDRARKTRVE